MNLATSEVLAPTPPAPDPHEKPEKRIFALPGFLQATVIIERMINQNNYDDIVQGDVLPFNVVLVVNWYIFSVTVCLD